MLCPECGEDAHCVVRTFDMNGSRCRVRQCKCCGYSWLTEEKPKDAAVEPHHG